MARSALPARMSSMTRARAPAGSVVEAAGGAPRRGVGQAAVARDRAADEPVQPWSARRDQATECGEEDLVVLVQLDPREDVDQHGQRELAGNSDDLVDRRERRGVLAAQQLGEGPRDEEATAGRRSEEHTSEL